MRPSRPIGVFLPVTLRTPRVHLLNIIGFQPHLFRDLPANVREQLADIFQMKSGIEREHIAMASTAICTCQ